MEAPSTPPGPLGSGIGTPGPRAGSALLQATYVNAAFWGFNRFLRDGGENPGFRIGLDSWRENFANGYEWDDNTFFTNQFGHPYQGSLYYTGARASGFGFWGSLPFAFFGSAQWEYTWETHHPSYNDWVTTSLGGAALGEMLWRVTDLVLDDTATGRDRHLREISALLLSPVRGINRIASGDWSRIRAENRRLLPNELGLRVEAGLRTVGSVDVSDADTTRAYLEAAVQYGDRFTDDDRRPFDTIEVSTLLDFGDASVLGGVFASGVLGATDLKRTDTTHHLLAGFLDLGGAFSNETHPPHDDLRLFLRLILASGLERVDRNRDPPRRFPPPVRLHRSQAAQILPPARSTPARSPLPRRLRHAARLPAPRPSSLEPCAAAR